MVMRVCIPGQELLSCSCTMIERAFSAICYLNISISSQANQLIYSVKGRMIFSNTELGSIGIFLIKSLKQEGVCTIIHVTPDRA